MGVASNLVAGLSPWIPRNFSQLALAGIGAFAVYSIILVSYRLFFHPLRKIPGPFLARATSWYEFYQDVILVGHYVKAYPEIHKQYGPVVRVSPDRIHVSDPEFFHEVYSSGSQYMKDPNFFQTSGGISEALPALVNPEYHKRRRKMVNNLFSAKSMAELSPIVLSVVKHALSKGVEAHENNKPLDIQRIYTGVTIDTIMRVLCDKQLHLLDAKEEEPPFMATLRTFSENFFVIKHFPFLAAISTSMPDSWSEKLLPGDYQFRQKVNSWIEERQEQHKQGLYQGGDGRTILDMLLQPDDGYAPLSRQSVVDETYSFCFAGTHTTSFTISLATYYLLRNPEKLEKLREELKNVPRNADGLMEYRNLVDLPYLTAVIKESLRLSSPVPGVLPRLVPQGGIEWAGHYLPAGTPVSIAIRMVHDNEKLFPEPAEFVPERWIKNKDLDHWLVVFGKGSRACIGLNVAWMESYLCIANFMTRFDMKLYDTDPKTTQWDDCGNAMIHKHIRVTIDGVS